ncbi:uncharacterized protein [Haliotis asinina]|uniref:uncharacterized protein n=1 Tax=Haliotis asinina TaxID=109174 RepID=UPI003531B56C
MKLHQSTPSWSFLHVIFLLVNLPSSCAIIEKDDLPPEIQKCYSNYAHVSLRDVVGQTLSWFCEAPAVRTLRNSDSPAPQPLSSVRYVSGLVDKVIANRGRRVKRQAAIHSRDKCVRREYRMLSDYERNAYHRAIIALKHDTSVEPNKYDALAALHTGLATRIAHFGPNFLGWHRVYLLMYEVALQEVDPSICLPYWDSSLDNELDDPRQSPIFSPGFIGGGTVAGNGGVVSDGPFAGWETPNDGPLIRNIGGDGELFTLESIEAILSRERTRDIVPPLSLPANDLEFHHGGVHVYIGGIMNQLDTAAYDPVFYLHHAFVDYIWELFRTRQRALRIDPQLDYPEEFGSPFHAPNETMGFNLNLTTEQGYSDDLTTSYEYDPSPDCSERRPTCGSRYLRCNTTRGRCYPVIPSTVTPEPPTGMPGCRPGQPGCPTWPPTRPPTRPPICPPGQPGCPAGPPTRPPTCLPGQPWCPTSPPPMSTPKPTPPKQPCKQEVLPTQNNFCIDGMCDTNGWVYVPVKVVSMRPPGLKKYDSYPISNGKVSKTNDIYQPSAYAETNRYINGIRGVPKTYDRCDDTKGFGQVYVQSNGLSYSGIYKEAAVTDLRLATSLSIAYVAVKDPRNGPVKALFRAFDSCGRICRTACKDPVTGRYNTCSGVLNIKDVAGKPKQYSKTYGEATLDTWDYAENEDCPSFQSEDNFLTFYCDYRDNIPWSGVKSSHSKRDPKAVVPMNPGHPVPQPSLPLTLRECKVSNDCILDVPCLTGKTQCRSYGETHKCRGSCNKYAVCNYGQFWVRSCPFDWSYHKHEHTCTSLNRCKKLTLPRPLVPNQTRPTWNVSPKQSSYFQHLGQRAINHGGPFVHFFG